MGARPNDHNDFRRPCGTRPRGLFLRGSTLIAASTAGDGGGEERVLHRLVLATGYVGALAHPAPPVPVRRFAVGAAGR